MTIFFINRFNDIDHMAPVIYKMAKQRNHKILVLSLNPNLDIFADYRLRFINENPNIQLDYLYCLNIGKPFLFLLGNLLCYYGKASKEQHLNLLMKSLFYFRWFSSRIIRVVLNRIFNIDESSFIKKNYDKRWIEDLFKKKSPKVLIFDHASHPKLYNVGSILKVARKMKIPTIDIPHGIPLFVKHPPWQNKAIYNLVNFRKDHMVLHQKWWKKELLKAGLDPKNTPILGSARFCGEWMEIMEKIVPFDESLNNIGINKMKVLFMDSPRVPDNNIVEDTINKISELDYLSLIIKPQTRLNKLLFKEPINSYVSVNENSINLIKWADVVIVLFSSIMVEVLIRGKCYIYPKYMHKGEMIYEKYGACWTVNNYDELQSALEKKYNQRDYIPYTQNNVDQFLNEVIFNGFDQKNVLNSYVNYINGVSRT